MPKDEWPMSAYAEASLSSQCPHEHRSCAQVYCVVLQNYARQLGHNLKESLQFMLKHHQAHGVHMNIEAMHKNRSIVLCYRIMHVSWASA